MTTFTHIFSENEKKKNDKNNIRAMLFNQNFTWKYKKKELLWFQLIVNYYRSTWFFFFFF